MAQRRNKEAPVLLQLTDTHLHAARDSVMPGDSQKHCVAPQQTLASVLDQARMDSRWPPDAFVVTGDIVQDESRAGYQHFREMLEVFDVPVFCIPGNHDNPVLMKEILNTPPFQMCGDAKLGKWRLILLSSHQQGEDSGALGQEGIVALEDSLSRYPDEQVLICMHHQPIPMGSAWLDQYGLRDAQDFLETIDRHDHVRGVLWGHVHQASDRERNNVRFLSTPSTCFQFQPNKTRCAYDARPPGYRWLELGSDGTISTQVEWVDTVVHSEAAQAQSAGAAVDA